MGQILTWISMRLKEVNAKDEEGNSIPGFCINTRDWQASIGQTPWTAAQCHEKMQADFTSVIADVQKYIVDHDAGMTEEAKAERQRRIDAGEFAAITSTNLHVNLRQNTYQGTTYKHDDSSFAPTRGREQPDDADADDIWWEHDLTNRVNAWLAEQQNPITAADRKGIYNSIKRKSNLNRRTFYTIRGRDANPDFGELSTVFTFSGKA